MRRSSVYVHFPWCLAKCPYCDFVSFGTSRESIDHRAYADAVLREAGTREQVTALLHRNPAAHAHIDRRGIRVTSLRTALKEAVANNQMTALTTLIGRDNPSTTRTALSACCSPCGTRVPMARSPCSTPATMSPRCAGP